RKAARKLGIAQVKLASGSRQILLKIRSLRRKIAVLGTIDDHADPDAAQQSRAEPLQDLRILEDADLDADLVARRVDRSEVDLAAILGQHGQGAGPQPGLALGAR